MLLLTACASRHAVFRVLPGPPEYQLRSPDSKNTPFPEVLGRYTDLGSGWVELQPTMRLRIENAYFRDAAAKRTIQNYVGTESVRFEVRSSGALRQLTVDSSLPQRPAGQPAVQDLMPEQQRRFTHHRDFYQVTFKREGNVSASILLGSQSKQALDQLTTDLSRDAASTCTAGSAHCTVFPSTCTVALEMELMVNGNPKHALWGTTVSSFAPKPVSLELLRSYRGKLVPVQIDAADPQALRLPLLPGDHLTWK
jgi:hypothetical protein